MPRVRFGWPLDGSVVPDYGVLDSPVGGRWGGLDRLKAELRTSGVHIRGWVGHGGPPTCTLKYGRWKRRLPLWFIPVHWCSSVAQSCLRSSAVFRIRGQRLDGLCRLFGWSRAGTARLRTTVLFQRWACRRGVPPRDAQARKPVPPKAEKGRGKPESMQEAGLVKARLREKSLGGPFRAAQAR